MKKLLLLIPLLLLTGCAKCLEGHYEMVYYPPQNITIYQRIGNITYPQIIHQNGYDHKEFKCDQYEKR